MLVRDGDRPMRTKALNLLLPLLLLFVPFATTHAVAQQGPPPPPAIDYFPDKWKEYPFQSGKFRIKFPQEPRETVNTHGQLEVHSVEYQGLLRYRVSYVDYKVPIDAPQQIKELLQGVKASALNAIKDKLLRLVAERELTVDGYRGIFVHIELQSNDVIRMQWVAAGSRLYTISTLNRKGSPDELEGKDDFEKVTSGFINSFHITP